MTELPQNPIVPTPDSSFLLSPEDLAAKQAKWQAEGYADGEIDELTTMLKGLSKMQDFERAFIAKGEEYWKEHPEELRTAEQKRKKYELKKVQTGNAREEMKKHLKNRELEKSMENIEGRDPEKFLNEVFDWIEEEHYSHQNKRDLWSWTMTDSYAHMGYMHFVNKTIPDKFIDVELKNLPHVAEKTLASGMGIPHLTQDLRGRKVLSVRVELDDGWYLKIIEPSRGEPKTFVDIFGNTVESTGLPNYMGYIVGDLLKFERDNRADRPAYYPEPKEEVELKKAKEIRVVGFGGDNETILLLDGNPNKVVVIKDINFVKVHCKLLNQ